MPMRVLLINQYFPPDAAATAYLVGELAEDLAREHDVEVVAGRPSYNPEASSFAPSGVRVRRAWSTTFARGGIGGRLTNYATFVASSLVDGLRTSPPDVVVGFTDPPVIGLVASTVARRFGRPFVYVCEDIFPDVGLALGRLDNPVVVGALRRMNHRLRRDAARIVAIGRDMEEKLVQEGTARSKIAMIPNWATPLPDDDDQRAELRRSMGWDDAFVLMHAGNVGLAQHLDIAIDAAATLRDTPLRFVVLGDGAARPRLEAKARGLGLTNVQFLPYRPKPEAQVLMQAADLHLISLVPGLKGAVVPSKMYGVMAAGRPFAAAVDEGSEPQLVVQDEDCGLWVPAGDAGALATTLRSAISTDLDAMGRRGRAALASRYSRTVATASYRDLLQRVAGLPRH
jgi:glycosyltransferase involved in cell wall biosynthesis